VEGSCEHGNEFSGSIKCWELLTICTTGGISRRAQLHGANSDVGILIDNEAWCA
jgi:hypothetical protein